MQNVDVHMAAAVAAIEVLVEAENAKGLNIEIKYREGSDKTVFDIINYDEIALKSDIVKQAIDRAQYVVNCIGRDSYTLILDGRATNLEPINGYEVRSDKDSKGNTYYFYGEYEKGYSYFTLDKNGNRAVYIIEGATATSAQVNGLKLYEMKVSGGKVYFTATAEDGYTYYIKDEYYDVYLPRASVVYNGVEHGKLDDGTDTQIYFDAEANVYYSVDENGRYSRYTFSKSLKSCYEEVLATVDEKMRLSFEMAEYSSAQDPNFIDEVERRIAYANATKKDDVVVNNTTASRYDTDNIVAVTYGSKDGDPYKTVILNYNNYTINITYDSTDDGIDNGKEYTIPAYSFVEIKYTK